MVQFGLVVCGLFHTLTSRTDRNVSDTRFVSFLRWKVWDAPAMREIGTIEWLRFALYNGPNWAGTSPWGPQISELNLKCDIKRIYFINRIQHKKGLNNLKMSDWISRNNWKCKSRNIYIYTRIQIHIGMSVHRVSQEERSVFWEVIVSVILSKKCTCTCVLFRTVSEIELFHCRVPKLFIRKIFIVFIIQVTKLVQFT
jgi:hypothetical protein